MRRAGLVLAALVAALLPGRAPAQEVDCANAMTQRDMNLCAARAYDAADAELNRVWRAVITELRRWDQYLPEGAAPAEETMRQAQRAWIPFRDAACEAESYMARGGSMQPLLRFGCLVRLTERRTEDLRGILDGG